MKAEAEQAALEALKEENPRPMPSRSPSPKRAKRARAAARPPTLPRRSPSGKDLTGRAPEAPGEVQDPQLQPLQALWAPACVLPQVGLCRICLREVAHEGYVPGLTKSSW